MFSLNSTLFMFPGQGSQSPGMAKSLLAEFPASKSTYEEADDSLHFSLSKLCIDGSPQELELTAHQQPAILTQSIAVWRVLQSELGIKNSLYFAGHSLGEYSSLVAAERLSFSHAVRTVRLRGESMQRAAPAGIGAMAAVLKFDSIRLQTICTEVSDSTKFGIVQVANFNSPEQQIISGHVKAVQEVMARLKNEPTRSVVKMLPVSAPFHSSLMKSAQNEMTPILEKLEFGTKTNHVLANVDAQFHTNYGADKLIAQICAPVLWHQSMELAHKNGLTHFVEVGPGQVLTGLVKRTLPDTVFPSSTADLKGFLRTQAG